MNTNGNNKVEVACGKMTVRSNRNKTGETPNHALETKLRRKWKAIIFFHTSPAITIFKLSCSTSNTASSNGLPLAIDSTQWFHFRLKCTSGYRAIANIARFISYDMGRKVITTTRECLWETARVELGQRLEEDFIYVPCSLSHSLCILCLAEKRTLGMTVQFPRPSKGHDNVGLLRVTFSWRILGT